MTTRATGSCKNAMQDGRAFTDYNPNCALNEFLRTKFGIQNNTDYRLFLQRNACKVMGEMKNLSEFDNPTGCKCNYLHPPHDYEHDRMYSKLVTPSEAFQHNKDMTKPMRAPGCGTWTNYC